MQIQSASQISSLREKPVSRLRMFAAWIQNGQKLPWKIYEKTATGGIQGDEPWLSN